jgi:23S rRNA-/tRNA-specific pseudouridylate synthase
MSLQRNFLHAAELELRHPRTGESMGLKSELPQPLRNFLAKLTGK